MLQHCALSSNALTFVALDTRLDELGVVEGGELVQRLLQDLEHLLYHCLSCLCCMFVYQLFCLFFLQDLNGHRLVADGLLEVEVLRLAVLGGAVQVELVLGDAGLGRGDALLERLDVRLELRLCSTSLAI